MFPPNILLNNPGAIEHSEDEWQGMTRLQRNKKLVRYISPEYGERALMKNLIAYEDIHGFHTLRSMIYRWAPPDENDTEAYLLDVSNRTGIPPNVLIDLHDIDVLIPLAKAITLHESGHPPDDMPKYWYTEKVYHEAALSALEEE